MMPEPAFSLVKTKRPDAKILIDLQKEWSKVSGLSSSYPQASLFVSGSAAEKYPDFINDFIKKYSKSIENLNNDPEAAGTWAASFLTTPPAKIIEKSIPGGNLKWTDAQSAMPAVEEYFNVLFESNPDSIGGSLPDEEFYYKK